MALFHQGIKFVIRLLSTFLFICLAINKPIYAQSACQNPVFGHSGIKIDQLADTANQAQQMALAAAHEDALAIVLDRLLLKEGADGATQNMPEGFEIVPQSVVQLVHIRSETSLPGRYIAEIDICFSADQLRALFAEANLEWAEVRSPLVLVLPVFADGAGTRAWQASHPWLSGWREEALQADGLLRFAALQPTLVNERQIKAEKLLEADMATLQKAALRAKAEQILWVSASISLEDDTPDLTMQAIIFDKQGEVIAPVANQQFLGKKADYESQFQIFRGQVFAQLEKGWQRANLRKEGLANRLVASIGFASHQDWIAKKALLANLPVINQVETILISSQGDNSRAIVNLDMNGSVDALRYALTPLGLSLSFDNQTAVIK